MKISMAGGIAAADECDCASLDRNAYKGGALELAPLSMARIMAGEGRRLERR